LWFIVPIFGFGALYFLNTKNIIRFFWLFSIGMLVVISYTLIHHATYGFGEKEGHWVMWPFFKDHTSYGALTALILPLLVGLYLQKQNSLIVQMVLILCIVIDLLGIYFSYTRAAWLSIAAAVIVGLLIHFKIKFKIIAASVLIALSIVTLYWTEIQFLLEKNKYEHTTEDFGERLQSATNVTSDASNLERINRWSCAIEMFKERPLFGFGPGTYAFEYARFQEPENLTIISTNFGDMGNAHSEYLGPLSETGAIGLLTFLGVVAMLFYKGITLYNNYSIGHHSMSLLILMMVLSLVTYFVHGILNNYLDTDKAAVPIWTMAIIFIVLEEKLKKEATIS
jgi:O-antigen ligase